MLTDGGVRNSVPTKTACALGATFILAVNPGFSVKKQKVTNVLKALVQSVQIMGDELNAYQAKAADVVIKPELGDIDQFDFGKSGIIVGQGEMAAEKKMHSFGTNLRLHRLGYRRHICRIPCKLRG